MALFHRMRKIWQCNCSITQIFPGWPGIALVFRPIVFRPIAAVSAAVSVPQQSTTSEPPCLVSRHGLLQEQGFSVELLPIKGINKDRLQVEVGPISKVVQRKFGGFIHTLCKTSLQDLNRRPSTIDDYRTVFDFLGPVGRDISQSSNLNRLLSSHYYLSL